ncbi:MAG: rod shape-determining protein MreC, partial [Gammaproteobacteria bacterium]
MMVMDYKQHQLAQVRSVLSSLVTPIFFIVDWPFDVLRKVQNHVHSRQALIRENTNLKREQVLANMRLQRLQTLETENKRLRLLLDSEAVTHQHRILIAEILKIDLDPFARKVIINKGSEQGVYLGQPIVDAYGIVGQIIEVGLFDSVVLLITDINHAIPVQSNRSGARAVATGTGADHELILSHVTTTADIKEGDLLVSSGLGGLFPQGYPVARVT